MFWFFHPRSSGPPSPSQRRPSSVVKKRKRPRFRARFRIRIRARPRSRIRLRTRIRTRKLLRSRYRSPQPRPSGPPSAPQRRTSSEVAWGMIGGSATTLLVRRRPHSEPEQMYRIVSPRGLPGTPRWRVVLRVLWALPRSLSQPLNLPLSRLRIPGAPAFWSAFGDPASHGQRGRWGMTGRIATTLPARRRPHSWPGEMHRIVVAVGCPASALCAVPWAAGRSYRHNAVPGTPR